MKALLFFSFFISIAVYGQKEQFDAILKGHKDFSGVLLVAENGKTIYCESTGYREFANQTPLKVTDIFELASVSKQFTAAIVMMLKEKGLLDYDDLVGKYLDIPYKGISIRHLLTHTSGLPDYQDIMDKHWDKSKVAGNEDCIAYLKKYAPPKLFEPGDKYEYSNTGYLLLASIAEKASGEDFVELCRNWIFRPLNMKSTDFRTPAVRAATKNFAIGHILVKERGQYVRADSFPSSDYTIWLGNRKGPGRISSTAADLLKWDQALYAGKLLKPATLEEAFSPMKLNNGKLSNYGFGWVLRSDPKLGKIVHHTGSNPGYSTIIIRLLDQKKTIVLLNNNAHMDFDAMAESVENLLK